MYTIKLLCENFISKVGRELFRTATLIRLKPSNIQFNSIQFNSIQFNSIFIGPTMEEIQFEYMQFEPDINHKFDKFNDYTL